MAERQDLLNQWNWFALPTLSAKGTNLLVEPYALRARLLIQLSSYK